ASPTACRMQARVARPTAGDRVEISCRPRGMPAVAWRRACSSWLQGQSPIRPCMSVMRHTDANWPRTGSAGMTAKAEDRRIQRTRALLLSALLDLIVEQRSEAITVQDI